MRLPTSVGSSRSHLGDQWTSLVNISGGEEAGRVVGCAAAAGDAQNEEKL